jgi:glycosyltransferase involved in cell wall biosynthesis
MGYQRSLGEIEQIKAEMADNPSAERKAELQKALKKYEFYVDSAKKSAHNSLSAIVISEHQKELFQGLFPEEKEKAILIKNGYNPEKFHVMDSVDKDTLFDSLVTNATPDGKLPKEYDKLVLFVGKFADFKGIDVMLDAAKIYEEQGKAEGMDIMTIIVGSGALDEPLRKQANQLNLQNTHFVGRKGPDVICPLQGAMRIWDRP